MATGGLFNRLKIWVFEEVLKSKDLNAEFDNIINHMGAQFIGGFSQTIAQMQLQANPGGLGSEVPATSLALEIEQLRFVIARITGNPFWFQSPPISLADANTLLSQTLFVPRNRLVSGRVRTTSAKSALLIPDGATAKVTLKATPTLSELVLFMQGVQYIQNTDVTFMGLSLAPSSGNTATVNDARLVGDYESKFAGEVDSLYPTITISGAGANITASVGQWAAFKTGTEVFLAFIKSPTELIQVYRGYFFDNLEAPINRVTLTNGATLTLLKLTWLFFNPITQLMDAVYNSPTYSATAPTSPSPGDYWFDIDNQIWNKFNGSAFVNSQSVIVGYSVQDTVGTIAARSTDFFASYTNKQTLVPQWTSGTEIGIKNPWNVISIFGNTYAFENFFPHWVLATDLEAGYAIAASTEYFLYVTELGKFVFSPEKPYDETSWRLGKYHPYNTWLNVGRTITSAGSIFVQGYESEHHELQITGSNANKYITTPAGYLRRLGTADTQLGWAYYWQDTTSVSQLVIRKSGIWTLSWSERSSSDQHFFGFSLNAPASEWQNQPIQSATQGYIMALVAASPGASGAEPCVSKTRYFSSGDTIQLYSDAQTGIVTDKQVKFTLTYVGPG